MKLLVISDLHITDNKHLSTFGWKAEEFIGKIETIKKRHSIDKVVLNGDTFDLYKGNYGDIALRNKKLIDYLNEIGSVFIKGNHDARLGYGQDRFEVINGKREKILIEHGHRGDFINGNPIGRFLGKLFYMILILLARLSVTRAVYFHFIECDDGLKGHGKYNSYKYLRYALNRLRKYDLVILGHTHKLEIHDTYRHSSKKRYINCGSCSFGRFQGIVIDTETLKHSTIRIDSPQLSAISQVTSTSSPAPRPRKRIQVMSGGGLVAA
jgi:predicted phosphodiesterase